MYPLAHNSLLHLLFNLVALVPVLGRFEKVHGTVYTGVILNLLAVTTALLYCIFGMVLYPSTYVVGASGWVFSFITFYACKEHAVNPEFRINPSLAVPTKYTPFGMLAITTLLAPGSSFWGHLWGIAIGYVMAAGYLYKLAPPGQIISKIESYCESAIALIPFGIQYYHERSVDRSREYSSVLGGNVLPVLHQEAQPSSFQGAGRVLGDK